MNQTTFDGMSADQLETLITCQRESTELEIMLVNRLIATERDAYIEFESDLSVEIRDLEESIEELEGVIGEVENLANGDDGKEAIKEILLIVK